MLEPCDAKVSSTVLRGPGDRKVAWLLDTYERLDPTLPKSGAFQARWRLQLNIDKAELEAIPHT
jgi:predicted transcriptional regulator of viral defense system